MKQLYGHVVMKLCTKCWRKCEEKILKGISVEKTKIPRKVCSAIRILTSSSKHQRKSNISWKPKQNCQNFYILICYRESERNISFAFNRTINICFQRRRNPNECKTFLNTSSCNLLLQCRSNQNKSTSTLGETLSFRAIIEVSAT